MKHIKLQNLKVSPEITGIRPVNVVVVSRYAQAMRQGATFPPITITKDGTIVKGNHRYQAYLKEYPDDYEISVEVKSYKTKADMVEDSIRDNAQHGYQLDGISRKRAIFALSKLGRTDQQIADLLGVSVRRVVEIAGLGVIVVGQDGEKEEFPIKGGAEAVAKKRIEITEEQYTDHINRDRCMYVKPTAEQLAKWLRQGWVDLDNAGNIKALQDLYEAIEETVMVKG